MKINICISEKEELEQEIKWFENLTNKEIYNILYLIIDQEKDFISGKELSEKLEIPDKKISKVIREENMKGNNSIIMINNNGYITLKNVKGTDLQKVHKAIKNKQEKIIQEMQNMMFLEEIILNKIKLEQLIN